MVQANQFVGRPQEDPNTHLRKFINVCDTIRLRHVHPDQIRSSLFPFSLRDQAAEWYDALTPPQKQDWMIVIDLFLEEYFPESKVMDIQWQISSFNMNGDEEFCDAWKRFKALTWKCTQHGYGQWQLVRYFYKGIPRARQSLMDARAGMDTLRKPVSEAWELME